METTRPIPCVPTGWSTLDDLIGIGGYPERRLTHIQGPPDQTLELTRGWGSTIALTTLDALDNFKLEGQPDRLLVNATALQGRETWPIYDRLLFSQFWGEELPVTVVWVTASDAPKTLKYAAFLRLECKDDHVCIVKNLVTARQGYRAPLVNSSSPPP